MPRTTSKTNTKSYTHQAPMKTPPPPLQTQSPQIRTPMPLQSQSHTPLQSHPPSMFDTMKQGFSFGVGSSIAHSIFGPKNKDENVNKKEVSNETKLSSDKIYEIYNKCLEKNDNNIDCNVILQSSF
jgi:hypothetical protein